MKHKKDNRAKYSGRRAKKQSGREAGGESGQILAKSGKKSGKKPSIYCKEDLKFGDVKSAKFLREYFKDINRLVNAVNEYKRVSKVRADEYALADLIK